MPSNQQLVVEHGDIPGFMEAMTMGYKVHPPSLLDNLGGDAIRFTIDTAKKAIVGIEPLTQMTQQRRIPMEPQRHACWLGLIVSLDVCGCVRPIHLHR